MTISIAKLAQFITLYTILFMGILSNTYAQPKQNNDDVKDEVPDSLSRIVEIDKIFITGNKRTKDHIITRELDVMPGERYSYEELLKLLKIDRNKVYNTSLFNTVEIRPYDIQGDKVVIQVDVQERWYFYPIPKIDFVDRNFNDWVQNHDADFSRLNYGIKFTQYNFRGRNERLAFLIQGGYTKQFGLQYSIPYIDRNQRTGLSFKFDYGENTNTVYTTDDHLRLFVDSDLVIRRGLNSAISVTRRNSFYNTHNFGLEYDNKWVGDTVIALNPNFFRGGVNQQKFFTLGYAFVSDHRDIIAYPLKGHQFKISAIKKGIGIFGDVNMFHIFSSYSRFWELKKRFFVSNHSSAYISFPGSQDYINSTGLGYGPELIRGFELYTIEGKSYLLNKTTFKKELVSILKNMNAIPLEQFQTFPLSIYLKTYFDFGYVSNLEGEGRDQNTRLTDKIIWGTGFGVDFFTMYDLVVRTEFSINSEFQKGFFIHFRKEF